MYAILLRLLKSVLRERADSKGTRLPSRQSLAIGRAEPMTHTCDTMWFQSWSSDNFLHLPSAGVFAWALNLEIT